MKFSGENKLLIWCPYQMKADKWDKFSIPLLCKKMLADFKKEGVHAIIPIAKTHKEKLQADYFSDLGDGPGSFDFIDVDVSYVNGVLHIHDFKELQKRTDFKVVLNTEPFQSRALKTALAKPAAFFNPEMVNYVLFSPDEDLFSKEEKYNVVLSLLMNKAVFNGPASMAQSLAVARSVFSPSLIKDSVEKNWVKNSLGINCGKIDGLKVMSDNPPYTDGVVRFLYGGRLSHHKHIEDTIDVVKYLHESGMKVEYTIQTYGQNSCKKLEGWANQYPFIKPLYNVPQLEFYKNAQRHDIFICASRTETYGLSFFEMLYSGMVGIFYKQPWQNGIVPKDYPLIAENKNQMMAMAKDVAGNVSEWQNKLEGLRTWIFQNENSSTKNSELLAKLESWAEVAK